MTATRRTDKEWSRFISERPRVSTIARPRAWFSDFPRQIVSFLERDIGPLILMSIDDICSINVLRHTSLVCKTCCKSSRHYIDYRDRINMTWWSIYRRLSHTSIHSSYSKINSICHLFSLYLFTRNKFWEIWIHQNLFLVENSSIYWKCFYCKYNFEINKSNLIINKIWGINLSFFSYVHF